MSQLGIAYLQTPAIICNESLDMIGASDMTIGDHTDGTDVAEVVRRNYGQLLRQLLRTAHWSFARKNAKLTLLADASGQTPNVSLYVERPWRYAYAWPIDGLAARWMPFTWTNGPTGINSAAIPQNPVAGFPLEPPGTSFYQPQIPARFLVSSSDQYPVEIGSVPWTELPDLQRTEGVGPNSRRVVLTNCCEARLVYTALIVTIEEWDSLFRQAMVSLLALALIPVAIKDPKLRLAERDKMIAIARNAIADARVVSAQDAGYPQSTDFEASWITARNRRGFGYGGTDGLGGISIGGIGYLECGWSSFSFGGSVF